MPVSATLCVPVEIGPSSGDFPRLFRLAVAVSAQRLDLAQGLPDEPGWLHDPFRVRFHLPRAEGAATDPAIECHARAFEVVLDRDTENERAIRGGLELIGLAPEAAERIDRYVEERLLQA